MLLRGVCKVIWQVSYINSANSRKTKGKLIKTLLALVKSPTVPRSVNEF